MIRTGAQYRDFDPRRPAGLYRRRAGEGRPRPHPMFKPLVDIRARASTTCSMRPATRDIMSYADGSENPRDRQQASPYAGRLVGQAPGDRYAPRRGRRRGHAWSATKPWAKMWSLFDGQGTCSTKSTRNSPRTSAITVAKVLRRRPVSMSRPTPTPRAIAPSRRRSRIRTCCCMSPRKPTPASWCAAPSSRPRRPYANQAFTKPTIANWGNDALSDYAVGLHLRFQTRPTSSSSAAPAFAGRAPKEDYPLANRFDEVDALVIFDNVLIPWEKRPVLPAHQGRLVHPLDPASLFGVRLHPGACSRLADMMIGVALFNVRQTGLDKQQAVQEEAGRASRCTAKGSTPI